MVLGLVIIRDKQHLQGKPGLYFVNHSRLHVYCALVDLDSSDPPGVRPTRGLTSSTQVVCVYAHIQAFCSPEVTLVADIRCTSHLRTSQILSRCHSRSLGNGHVKVIAQDENIFCGASTRCPTVDVSYNQRLTSITHVISCALVLMR